MKYSYKILSESLRDMADVTINYFVKKRGVARQSVKVEEKLDALFGFKLPLRPTFHARSSDYYVICIEVGDSPYNPADDDFVITCMQKGFPIKLYTVLEKGSKDPQYSQKLGQARLRGVGVIEIDGHSVDVIAEAIPLSLTAARPINPETFPVPLREPLVRAEAVFRNGSPDKACLCIYQEIEHVSRQLAKKAGAAAAWKRTFRFDYDHGAWAKLMEHLTDDLDLARLTAPELKPPLLARVRGITPHRNDSGHKPADSAALIKRDRELRTRYEFAIDLLEDFVAAVKPLRII